MPLPPATGRVAVLNTHQEIVALKKEGDYFGDLAVIMPAKRSATVVALANVVRSIPLQWP